mgnify:CR=1 FL=1
MKSLVVSTIILAVLSLAAVTSYADCQGCCSHHDGVCCIDGVTMCCDGTSLSDTCKEKGCNVCNGNGDDGGVGCFITTVISGSHDVGDSRGSHQQKNENVNVLRSSWTMKP